MKTFYLWLAGLLSPLVLLFAVIEWRIRRREARTRRELVRAARLGMDQPVSLHPHIDPDRCIGSGACVAACPEKDVLGLASGRGTLVHASACVGHGACAAACPVGAIALVFGTSRRGVDIPRVSPDFETNVPGLFLAGEVGGMGLLRNAVEQGRQAMRALAASLAGATPAGDAWDAIIVGTGPAGLSAALAAKAAGLRALVLEQDDPGGSVLHYPRGKLVLTRPLEFPGRAPVPGPRLSKEQLMDLVEDVAGEVEVRRRARVVGIAPGEDAFDVRLEGGEALRARRVLLAVGRRGSPRKLGVPGEDQGKVVYQLKDPDTWAGKDVLVVGGGNSAIEAALMLAEAPGTTARLSYRGDSFHRVAPETRARLDAAVAAGRLQLLLKTEVLRVEFDRVVLAGPEGEVEIPNDGVVVQIGGTLPTAFLRDVGVLVDVHHGKRVERSDQRVGRNT